MTVTENRLIAWSRSLVAVAVVGALATLGIANVATYSRWHEVEDGVFWSARAEGVTASDFSIGSPAKTAGLQRGDVLLAINGQPVQTPSDVIEVQHRSHEGTTLTYTVLRLASQQALQIALTPAPRGPSMYYALAAFGLFTLLVGASVRLRRPGDQATLHFFWLGVSFFGGFSFSFTGRRQLRWIPWGTALGVGPFAVGYALPWALGFNPTLTQFTAVLLGLVPVTFACAIVRYRLRDVEVIIKSGLTYAAF